MSKPRGIVESLAQAFVLIFIGFVGFIFTRSLFMLFFVPLVLYYAWWNYDRTKELERRLSQLEGQPVRS